MQIKPEHLEQLEKEVQHIFDSGANEIRVYNMIQAFIEKQGEALFIPIVSQQRELLAKYTKWQNEVNYSCDELMYADIDKFLNG